jgi:hypothetical protein
VTYNLWGLDTCLLACCARRTESVPLSSWNTG